MQQWIDLNTKVANDGLAALKQLGKINLKAAESLFGQQKAMFDGFSTTTKSNIEKLASTKGQQDFVDLQKEIFQGNITSTLENWKKTVTVASTSTDAYRNLAEEVMQTAKSNMEQTATSVKQSTEAVKKAVKPTAKKSK